jgi:putative nucleotidyltransferase with HDIG domain
MFQICGIFDDVRAVSDDTGTLRFERSDQLVGRTVGGYRLVTALRSGGMGTVYYAEHTLIGRRAAIKILHPEIARDPQVVSRFFVEARAANDIRHPNVVEITDIGQSGDMHYIVMSFLEGETVGERLERIQVLEEDAAVRIVRQVASALAAAHDRGIVHRDLKPENIFLLNHPDYPDYVKVLDFGIAKLVGRVDPTASANAVRNTTAGMVLGTPAYMSPEQCRPEAALDHRSDIYSLGVVLYEMLTGRTPFRYESPPEVMLAHIGERPVPPIDLNPKLSKHINLAILRALEKEPGRRFADMRELRDAIDNVVRPAARAKGEPAQESAEDRNKRQVTSVVKRLTDIVLRRLETDSLLVPAMPAIALQCMKMLDDPNQSFKNVGDLVAKDPLLASRILRLANSAAFPGRTSVTTLDQSIARMGTEGLKLAICHHSIHQAFSSKDERIQAAFRGIWEHSIAVALIAKEVAAQLDDPALADPPTVYLVGLLHDVGKPVVAALLLEAEKLMAVQKASMPWISHEVWRQVVDRSHREIGVALARRWNLPAAIGDAIEKCVGYDVATPHAPSNVVCLANAFAKVQGLYAGDYDAAKVNALLIEGKELLDMPDEALALLCAGLYGRVGSLFDVNPAPRG